MRLDNLDLFPEVHKLFAEAEKELLACEGLSIRAQLNIAFEVGRHKAEMKRELLESKKYSIADLDKQFKLGEQYISNSVYKKQE